MKLQIQKIAASILGVFFLFNGPAKADEVRQNQGHNFVPDIVGEEIIPIDNLELVDLNFLADFMDENLAQAIFFNPPPQVLSPDEEGRFPEEQ